MVNFSPSVGWCHPICMLHTDLFRDPQQHPISRLYLRNDLLALCILVWETDIYFHFDIWTTEHTSGILAGRDASLVLADSVGRHHIQTKILRAAESLQQSYIKTWETFNFQKLGLNKRGYSVNSKEEEVFIFPLAPETCLQHPHSMCNPAFQNWWTPDGIPICTDWPWPVCPWPHTFLQPYVDQEESME